jgi:hypothetical protein
MAAELHITGWGKKHGAAYKIVEHTLDRKRHRRERTERIVREHNGRSISGPAWQVIEDSGSAWLALNAGHNYSVRLSIGGTEIVGAIDASGGFHVMSLGVNEAVIGVEPIISKSEEPEADNDAPEAAIEDKQDDPADDEVEGGEEAE